MLVITATPRGKPLKRQRAALVTSWAIKLHVLSTTLLSNVTTAAIQAARLCTVEVVETTKESFVEMKSYLFPQTSACG